MTAPVERVECVVVGAGVVGLAVARALAQRGHEVLVIEANGRIGEQASSRSNEVVHAGFLYPPHSLKEQLCLRGRAMLLEYCGQRGIEWRRTGKLLPATDDDELALLRGLLERARALGLDRVQWLEAEEVHGLEPALRCRAALYSPDSGIVDSHGLLLALLADAEAGGAVLATRALAMGIERTGDARYRLDIDSAGHGSMRIECERVVNAAGVGALALARTLADYPAALLPQLQLAQGSFYGWQGPAPFRHLVMPVGATLPAGGACTLDLAGQARFGPLLRWLDAPDHAVVPDAASRYAAAIRRYWPEVDEGRLVPAYAGIQPRIAVAGGRPADWAIQGPAQHGRPGLVHLFAIDTPGLTACLATAQHVVGLLEAQAGSHAPRIERSLHAH